MTNRLYYGDNLEVLRAQVADESVDLIYLDPPFNSNASYNILFRSTGGTAADSQIEAFDDSWHWGASAEAAYDDVMKSHHTDVGELLRTMRSFLRDNDMMAYLAMMAVRLIELHRVLKPTGSLYLHCDPTASHYLKLLLDGVFGPTNFRTEIVWKRTFAHGNVAKTYGDVTDTIFFYTKANNYTWNQPFKQVVGDKLLKKYPNIDPDGRRWQSVTLRNPGMRPNLHYPYTASNGVTYQPHPNGWSCNKDRMDKYDREGRLHFPSSPTGALRLKMFEDETLGERMQSLWDDVPPISSQAQERLGYPTQKPLALLERIISASSNPGDVVLDPFCGCGTALEAAQTLGRQWIGIDVTHLAIHLIEKRLHKKFGEDAKFTTEGRPKDLASAEELARRDKHEFQKWITTFIDGVPWRGGRKGADGGIDGLINFDGYDRDADKPVSTKAIISVKGGANKGVGFVSELVETIARENAAVGVLVMAALPTREMEKRAAAAGFYDLGPYGRFARIQILTLAEIIQQGKRPHLPNIDRKPVGKAAVKSTDPRQGNML